MTNTEEHDLLIKLDTQMVDICMRLGKIEHELTKRQCLLHRTQIDDLKNTFNPMLCSKNTEKINTIEKLTWAGLIAVFGLIAKSFWSAVTT